MGITRTRLAVAAALALSSLPVLAAEDASAPGTDCSVCGDPTWPGTRSPAPAIALRDADTGPAAVQNDPTFPETARLAPAIVVYPDSGDGPSIVQSDPTFPQTATLAPSIHLERAGSEERVAHAKPSDAKR